MTCTCAEQYVPKKCVKLKRHVRPKSTKRHAHGKGFKNRILSPGKMANFSYKVWRYFGSKNGISDTQWTEQDVI